MVSAIAARSKAADTALRNSGYASSTSGEQAVWRLGFFDGYDGEDERRAINHYWRPVYIDGLNAGRAANQTADTVTDIEAA